MGNKQVAENIIYNIFRTAITIIYPVITFSYITRIISVESIGKVNYAKNLVTYFCLAASLGINYYGTREGARVLKQDKTKFSVLFWEIIIINICTTTVSFGFWIFTMVWNPNLMDYRFLLVINSASIILGGLSCEWVLCSVEKYKFIAIRTLLIQLCCLTGIFVCIRTEEDYFKYAIFLVVSGYGSSVFNWIFIKKNKLVEKIEWKKIRIKRHLKPILILFTMLITIDLYTLMDTTMLGALKGDWSVGIYSAAIKVPRLVNSMIAAVGTVLVPRLSYYYEIDQDKFNKIVEKAMQFVFMITIPCAIGVFGMAEEIILLLCGERYKLAVITLRILTPLILIIPISVLFNNQIFIPMKKEIYVLQSTCAGAFVNLVSNLILIPRFSENGAAIGSVLAEFVVMLVCLWHVKKKLKVDYMSKKYIKCVLIGSSIIPIIIIAKILISFFVLRLLFCIIACSIIFLFLSRTAVKQLINEKY